jgi:kynurenine formamidase
MPVYPGTEQPVIDNPCTIDNCGFAEKKITFFSHTGTHMDAPCHIIKGAPCLEDLRIGHFTGSGIVLDISGCENDARNINLDDLIAFKDNIAGMDFVLLFSSWGKFWGSQKYFENYPVLTPEAANWLSGFNLKGIGVDMISLDPVGAKEMIIHKIFLSKNTVIIENLTGLEELSGKCFIFNCMPLKIENADGSPVRAFAVLG